VGLWRRILAATGRKNLAQFEREDTEEEASCRQAHGKAVNQESRGEHDVGSSLARWSIQAIKTGLRPANDISVD